MAQLKVSSHLKTGFRAYIKENIYNKPKEISLKESNAQLYTFAFMRDPFKRLVSAYYYLSKKRKFKEKLLTPKIFVKYLLEEVRKHGPLFLNSHLRPQYAACPFCSLNFDYIGELEDMDIHVTYLAEHLGFPVILGKTLFFHERSYH